MLLRLYTEKQAASSSKVARSSPGAAQPSASGEAEDVERVREVLTDMCEVLERGLHMLGKHTKRLYETHDAVTGTLGPTPTPTPTRAVLCVWRRQRS